MQWNLSMKVKWSTEWKKLLWCYSAKICTLVLKTSIWSLHRFGWYEQIDRLYRTERSCCAAIRKSHSKELLVGKFVTAKEVLASCWIQAQVPRKKAAQGCQLADAKRSSCMCIIFGLYVLYLSSCTFPYIHEFIFLWGLDRSQLAYIYIFFKLFNFGKPSSGCMR